jgi:hypothetical protein
MSSEDLHPVPAWGHGGGFLSLGGGAPLDDQAALADRLLILERLHRYSWCYDERRPELLGDCFTEDGVWEGNVMGEVAIGPFSGRREVVAWLSEFWPHQRDQRRHMFLNAVVEEQSSDRARALAYLLLFGAKRASVRLETSAFYRVDLLKQAGGWRISHMFAGFDAPFWPGALDELSPRARARHGIRAE